MVKSISLEGTRGINLIGAMVLIVVAAKNVPCGGAFWLSGTLSLGCPAL